MSKLFKLKEWLTIEDAAKRLSISVGEDVSVAEILRLAIDGHLTLSVRFVNHAHARKGQVVGYTETRWKLFPPILRDLPKIDISEESRLDMPTQLQEILHATPLAEREGYLPVMCSENLDNERFLNLDDNVTTLKEVWDLPMLGGERLDVEHAYQALTGGPDVTLESLGGAFVSLGTDIVCQLQESWDNNPYQAGSLASLERLREVIHSQDLPKSKADNLLQEHAEDRVQFLSEQRKKKHSDRYYPAGGLPTDAVFVVRTAALREFEARNLSEETQPEKPMHASERRSASQVIAALAAMANLDLESPYKAVNALRAEAAKKSLELPGSDETIVKCLRGLKPKAR